MATIIARLSDVPNRMIAQQNRMFVIVKPINVPKSALLLF